MKFACRFIYTFLSATYLIVANVTAQEQNILLNKPVTATSESPGHPAKNAVDGAVTRTSTWVTSTGKAPHVLEIDLLKYYIINELRVHSGIADAEKKPDEMVQAAGFWSVKNFKMQYWDDANWSDFPQSEVHENRLTTVIFKYSSVVTTFKVRLVCDDGEPINIMEIEAIGTEAQNMPAPPKIASGIIKQQTSAESKATTITVNKNVVGKSLKYVGYNQGYYFPGSNVSGWIEYSNVNSLRLWASLNAFVPQAAVQVDSTMLSVEEFDKRKIELRADPENNKYIRWNDLTPLYDRMDSSSTNAMVFNYALAELKKLGIDVILQIGTTDFDNTWGNKWKQWQRFYALAYYAAKKGDVAMYAMQNEPNHRNSGPMKLDQWISGMQVVSDAIHCAVEDVNKKYTRKLHPKFVGPVTAGNNPEWWAEVAKAIRTDYHGKTVEKDLMEIFSTHSYNSPAIGYESRIDNIRKIITGSHPAGEPLPIVYTEIGRWMNAYLIDKEETMDSPSLFTEWAGIYSNNMKNGGYGMWAFKFANTSSGPYPRGIKSGHHYIWQGKRIVEDAYKNLALNKPVKTSTSKSNPSVVTDGKKSTASAWVSDSASVEKWIEIDLGASHELGSSVVYTGSADGVYTSPDRIKNYTLQYLAGSEWKDIPGASEKDGKYAQVFTTFSTPVKTGKVRFTSTDKGSLKVREIKLFAKGDGPSDKPDYNISGIQRTGEVVRLFAKGFKDQRDLVETKSSVYDPGLDAHTSYDEKSGNYYIWLVQRGLFDYNLKVNLANLNVSAGTPVIAETVNEDYYGEATHIIHLPADKTFNFTLNPQSVVLISIPAKNKLVKATITPSGDATVSGGKNALSNYGSKKQLVVQLDAAKPENNKVSYIHFNLSKVNVRNAQRMIVSVNGHVGLGEKAYRLHVYAIPSNGLDQQKINWRSAPQLDDKEALIKGVGQQSFIAGELAFDTKDRYHHLDVTDVVKKHSGKGVSFVFVRETRQLGDDEDKERQVVISSLESTNKPRLEVWYNHD
ncbi:MAG: discoidin domain-containing protein [Chitinophagaceae bacterium]